MDDRGESDWVESALGIVGTFLVFLVVVWYAHANIPRTQTLPADFFAASKEGASISSSEVNEPSTMGAVPSGEDLAMGGELYQIFCATCHGMPGQRSTVGFWLGSDLFDGISERDDSPSGIRRLIEEGILEEGMAPMKEVLSDQQIGFIVSWMLDQRQNTVP